MFYENLKRLCFERGISLSKMAADLRFSTTTATGWKRGAQPRSAQVKKIAEYFDVTTDELMYEIPEELLDSKTDLIDILKSQQNAILNFSESGKNNADANKDLAESIKNFSESHKNISDTGKDLAKSIKNFSESHKNQSNAICNISESNKNLSVSIKNFSEKG